MDNDSLIVQTVFGFIRHSLGALGGSLVGRGYLTGDQSEALAGAIMAIVAVGWSIWKARRNAKLHAIKNEIIQEQGSVIEQKTAEIQALR